MKQLLIVLALAFAVPAFAGGEEKKVCEKVLDNKTKKEKEVCKTIKVHKKFEGTKVPTPAPNAPAAKKPAAKKPTPKKK